MAIPAFFRYFGFSIGISQVLNFFFWFIITAFGVYSLSKKIFSKTSPIVAPVIATTYYLFNLWQEHVWLAFKPPLVTSLALIPWLFCIFWDKIYGKDTTVNFYIKIAIVGFLFGGIGNNTSEMFSSSLYIISFVIFLIIANSKSRFVVFKLVASSLLLILIINSYWIIPVSIETLRIATGTELSNEFVNMQGWLEGISKHTSFSNVLRFLGDWTWYEGVGEPYRLHASLYFQNIIFIFISWLIPLMVLVGFIFSKFKWSKFFAITTLIALWLSMGSNGALGGVFLWLYTNVPFFWIVRSPYFKFMLVACLGYSIFIGSFAAWLSNKFYKGRSLPSLSIAVCIVTCIVVYGFPIATGSMYTTSNERKSLPPDKIIFPEYISTAAKYFNDDTRYGRIFALNRDRFWTTTWGYRSFSPLLSQFTWRSLVSYYYHPQYSLIAQGSENYSNELVATIQNAIFNGSLQHVQRLFRLLGVRWILLDKSLVYYTPDESFQYVKKRLDWQEGINLSQSFGNYLFYECDSPTPIFYTTYDVYSIDGGADAIGLASQGLWPENPCFIENDDKSTISELQKEKINIESIYTKNRNISTINFNSTKSHYIFDTHNIQTMEALQTTSKKCTFKLLDKNFYNYDNNGSKILFLTTNSDNFIINNSATSPINCVLSFDTISHLRDRDLYVYINNILYKINKTMASVVSRIVIPDIVLQPGDNIGRFYTPYQGDKLDNEVVSFGFLSNSFKVGTTVYKLPFPNNLKGNIKIRVVQSSYKQINVKPISDTPPRILINGSPVELFPKVIDESINFSTTIDAPKDNSELTVEPNKFLHATIFIESEPSTYKFKQPTNYITEYHKVSPVEYYISLNTKNSSILMFNESYSPRWNLINLTNKNTPPIYHFKANSYANAYLLSKPGKYKFRLYYQPQNELLLGAIISLIGTFIFFAIVFFFCS